MERFEIKTQKRYELVDVTKKVEEIVEKSGVEEGLVLVFVPHSTAGVLVTENESGLKMDWIGIFEKIFSGRDFQHDRIDDNADSHLLSGLVGQSKVFPVSGGKLVRGTWQQIFVADFDGPRIRKVVVQAR